MGHSGQNCVLHHLYLLCNLAGQERPCGTLSGPAEQVYKCIWCISLCAHVYLYVSELAMADGQACRLMLQVGWQGELVPSLAVLVTYLAIAKEDLCQAPRVAGRGDLYPTTSLACWRDQRGICTDTHARLLYTLNAG